MQLRGVIVATLAMAASSCSAPIEPEQAPDRIVTTETEGGATVTGPLPERTFSGCTREDFDASGRLTQWARELVDEQGHVVATAWGEGASVSSMALTYDDRGRIRSTSRGDERSTFVYDGDELRVETTVGNAEPTAKRFLLDERGLVTYAFFEQATLHWLDQAHLLDYAADGTTRSYSWDDGGFLLDASYARASFHCSRRFSWTKAEHSVAFVSHDDFGSETWSGAYSFDGEGRMVHAVVGEWPATTWRYEAGWSVAALPGGSTTRMSAECHYPPSREDFARSFASAISWPGIERRPTHVPRIGPLPYPPSDCDPPSD